MLRGVALSSTTPDAENLYGRSAFNRYYYSAFLVTRSLVRQLHAEWGAVAHANMPDVIRKVRKEILAKQRQFQKSQLHDRGLARDADDGATAAQALAGLLEQAYQVRIRADYYPEELVERRRDDLLLCNTNISEAARWCSKAHHFCNQIESAWRQLGLI